MGLAIPRKAARHDHDLVQDTAMLAHQHGAGLETAARCLLAPVPVVPVDLPDKVVIELAEFPAWAGETSARAGAGASPGDHPRVGGGNS